MFFSSLTLAQLDEILEIVISYDIVCQWSVNGLSLLDAH
jgi:hypothetical protein